MTDILDLVQLSNNNNMGAAQLLLDVGDSAMLFNTSNTEPFFIGNNPALTPTYANAIEIAPLGYLVITAQDEPIYGVVNIGVQLTVAVLPGGIAFFTPQLNATITGPVTIAGAVDATIVGTPDVSISGDITFDNTTIDVVGSGGTFPAGGNTVLAAGSLTIPASSVGTVNVGNCTLYTAFNLVVNGYCTAQATAGAPLQVLVEMQWYDSPSFTQITDDDSAWIWIGNSASNLCNAYAKGPMQSSELVFFFHNVSTTEPLTVNYSFDGTARTFTESNWWQAAPVSGLMNAGISMQLGAGLGPTDGTANDLLCLLNDTAVAASVTVWQPLPLKAPGLSNWNFNTSVALNNAWTLNIAAGLVNGGVAAGSGAVGAYWSPGNAASTPYTTQLVLPRAPLYYVIHTTATASNVGVVGVSSDI